MPLPEQLQQGQVSATLASQEVSSDNTTLIQTYTVTLTQPQLTMQLAQAQMQVANLTRQIANINVAIENLQSQLALFPAPAQVATPAQPAGVS